MSDGVGEMTGSYSVNKIQNCFPRNTSETKEHGERNPGPTSRMNGCEKMQGRILV